MDTPFEFELQIRRLPGQTGYLVDVDSNAGPASGFSVLDINEPEFHALYGEAIGAAPDLEPRQAFGERLFSSVFIGQVRDRWIETRARATEAGSEVRLRLRVEDPELSVLPWELMVDEDFVAASANVFLSRYLPITEPRADVVQGQAKVLLVVQSPAEEPVQDELINGLKDSLAGLSQRFGAPKILTNTPIAQISDELLNGYQVVHYIGHGKKDTLNMTDGATWNLRDAREFAALFAGDSHVRLVVMNVCGSGATKAHGLFSGLGPLLAARRIPAVVAMQYNTVLQKTAAAFNRSFYNAMATSCAVDRAVNVARRALRVTNESVREWSTPVVYMSSRFGRVLEFADTEREAVTRSLQMQLETAGRLADEYRTLLAAYEAVIGKLSEIDRLREIELTLQQIRRALERVQQFAQGKAGVDRGIAGDEWEQVEGRHMPELVDLSIERMSATPWWGVLGVEVPAIGGHLRDQNDGLLRTSAQTLNRALGTGEAWVRVEIQRGLRAVREEMQVTAARMSPREV